jgi:phytoene desaturase
MNKKSAIVIGAGFAGISAATYLASKGWKVTVLEKHTQAGGRARQFLTDGFVFDMGPSWYWMPDVFERYFKLFGSSVQSWYDLKRLDPSYRVFFPGDEVIDGPASLDELYSLFESLEPGSSKQLKKFLKDAEYKYNIGINELVHKPSRSVTEFADSRVISGIFKMHLFSSFAKFIRKYFSDPRILSLLEFPVLFLGAKPEKIPALYSLMNHADLSLGTWYPMGGMHKIVEGMVAVAENHGVEFRYEHEVSQINILHNIAHEVVTKKGTFQADTVIAGADYHHVENKLIPAQARNYSEKYWDKRVMAPSSLLFYLGVNKKLKNLLHHNLFFDEDFGQHAVEIYDTPQWPAKPLFYVSCPSVTDSSVAPEGMENLFVLIPIAPDLQDSDELHEKYYHLVMDRLEKRTGQSIRDAVIYKKTFSVQDFKNEYHAFKGNAYGLANTLKQTAILKPSLKNKKVKNLFYTGQLTVPGPGVPPSLISGEVVAKEVIKMTK